MTSSSAVSYDDAPGGTWRPLRSIREGIIGGRLLDRAEAAGNGTVAAALPVQGLTEIPLDTLRRAVVPVRRRPSVPRLDSDVVLQRWEGHVDHITSTGFVARLKDLSEANPDDSAEIPFDEVSPNDRDLIGPGAVFYWSIGYRDAVSGQRTRESVIRFRRLPRWTTKDREDAAARVERWKVAFRRDGE